MPRIDGNRAQLDRVEECEKVSADVAWLLLPTIRDDGLDPHFGRRGVRSLLLVEALSVDSVGKPFQHEWPILHCRQDEICDARVEAHHIALGVPILGKEDLVEIRDLEGLAATQIEGAFAAFRLDLGELSDRRAVARFLVCFWPRFRRRRATRRPGGLWL